MNLNSDMKEAEIKLIADEQSILKKKKREEEHGPLFNPNMFMKLIDVKQVLLLMDNRQCIKSLVMI